MGENKTVPETMIPSKKNNTGIIVLLVVLVLVLAGYIVYDKVIKKPQEDNITEKDNKDENPILDNLAGKVYKTTDGKKILKIVSKTDSKALEDAKKLNLNPVEAEVDYLGYYNDVFFYIYRDEIEADSRYFVLGGVKEGSFPQSRDTHSFIIDTKENILLDIDYEAGNTILIHRVGNKYYFSQGGTALSFMSDRVLDENLKVIGSDYYGSDDNGNIYVRNNKKITKYNSNGEVVKVNETAYESSDLGYSKLVMNDTIYLIISTDSKVYLLNGLTNEKYELGSVDKINFSDFDEFPGIELEKKDNIILINDPNLTGEKDKTVIFTFNPSTKELIKK